MELNSIFSQHKKLRDIASIMNNQSNDATHPELEIKAVRVSRPYIMCWPVTVPLSLLKQVLNN